ncbi:hypothetical protein ACVPOY_01565 [Staphylococcus aureus]
MTRFVKEYTGLPAERVIGSGTVLDSARLQYLLAKNLVLHLQSVDASIIGEHGDTNLQFGRQAKCSRYFSI